MTLVALEGTCHRQLKVQTRFGLEDEVKVNLEQGHAILAGHSFEHELAMATSFARRVIQAAGRSSWPPAKSKC